MSWPTTAETENGTPSTSLPWTAGPTGRGPGSCPPTMGISFYARPGWEDYGAILAVAPEASAGGHLLYNGMEVYYNGVDTIAEKIRCAREHLGGIMIWELTQDTSEKGKSLLQAVGDAEK